MKDTLPPHRPANPCGGRPNPSSPDLQFPGGTTAIISPPTGNTAPWINPFLGGMAIANSALLRPVITGADQILNLALGTIIDNTSNFALGESGSSTHVGLAANQFQFGAPGVIGSTFETTLDRPDY